MKELCNIINKCDNKVLAFQLLQDEEWYKNLDSIEQLKIIAYCILVAI